MNHGPGGKAGAVPWPVSYLYALETDPGNVSVESVKASVNGSPLETVCGPGKGRISAYWAFDRLTGRGPFNSFYAAVNIDDGSGFDNGETRLNRKAGTIAFVLDPYDLKKTVSGTKFKGKYNIMLIVPAVYWKSEGNVLFLSGSPDYDAGGTVCSGMKAYAHCFGDGKTFARVYPYIGLGVYEASVSGGRLQSVSGVLPEAGKTCDQFKACADNAVPAPDSRYQLWNFYQWTLYKMMAYTVMGTRNSQAVAGEGPVRGNSPSVTGLADEAGPYARSDSSRSKLFLENAWGSVSEFIGDAFLQDRVLFTGNALGGSALNGSQTSAGVSLPSSPGRITETSSVSGTWDFPVGSLDSDSVTGLDYPGDFVYPGSGRRSLCAGGSWFGGSLAGAACISGALGLSDASPRTGARLAYVMSGDAAAGDRSDL